MATCLIKLENWLQERAQVPFDYEHNNCAIALADWAVANGYRDGAATYRGWCKSEQDMVALVRSYGGLSVLVGFCAQKAGLVEARQRQIGTIGVIGARSNLLLQWGGIWDGSRWQVHGKEGFAPVFAPVLKMWSV